jgi:hypothetical protein
MLSSSDKSIPNALFLLRLGLGLFLLLWSLDKIIEPGSAVKVFEHFYLSSISETLAVAVGIAELLLSLAILAGVAKTVTYGLGLLLHAVSTLSTYEQLLHPFGKNHLFIAAIPVLFAFAALFLARERDTLFSFGGRTGRK